MAILNDYPSVDAYYSRTYAEAQNMTFYEEELVATITKLEADIERN